MCVRTTSNIISSQQRTLDRNQTNLLYIDTNIFWLQKEQEIKYVSWRVFSWKFNEKEKEIMFYIVEVQNNLFSVKV